LNFPRKITFRGKKCTKNWPQIGRILAHWVIIYFGQFFDNCRSSQHFGLLFSMVKVKYELWQKCIGLHFRRHFSQNHLVTLPAAVTFDLAFKNWEAEMISVVDINGFAEIYVNTHAQIIHGGRVAIFFLVQHTKIGKIYQ
jgi:hypothetical protein